MNRLADSFSAAQMVVVLDAGVTRDVAVSLSGLWEPSIEADPDRRAQLIAAAQLRLYATPDRTGWQLVTTRFARRQALEREDADWSVGFLPALEDFDDAPVDRDVVALRNLHREDGLDAEQAEALALGLLCDAVDLIVTRDPRATLHQRDHDLPERLAVIDPIDAVRRLDLKAGELPQVEFPAGSLLARSDAWWLPVAGPTVGGGT